MAEKKDKTKFYKKKSFWAAIASAIAGILAGNAGVVESITTIINHIVGS